MKKGVLYQSLNEEGGVLSISECRRGCFTQSLNEEGGVLSIFE